MTAFKNFFVSITLVGLIFTSAEAKIVTDKVPLLAFGDVAVTVCDVPNGTKKDTIPAETSLVLVKIIRPDGWAYGSYKPQNSKKRVYGWFNMMEFQGYSDFENYIDQLTYDTGVFRTRTLGSLNGNAPSNEDIIVVGKRGDRTKIIFKSDDNYYRMGWVPNNNLKKNSTNSETQNADTNVTSNTGGTSNENYSGTENEVANEWGDDDK